MIVGGMNSEGFEPMNAKILYLDQEKAKKKQKLSVTKEQ